MLLPCANKGDDEDEEEEEEEEESSMSSHACVRAATSPWIWPWLPRDTGSGWLIRHGFMASGMLRIVMARVMNAMLS